MKEAIAMSLNLLPMAHDRTVKAIDIPLTANQAKIAVANNAVTFNNIVYISSLHGCEVIAENVSKRLSNVSLLVAPLITGE